MHGPKARKELQILGKHFNLMSMCFWMFLIMYCTHIHIFSNVEPLFGGPPTSSTIYYICNIYLSFTSSLMTQQFHSRCPIFGLSSQCGEWLQKMSLAPPTPTDDLKGSPQAVASCDPLAPSFFCAKKRWPSINSLIHSHFSDP